MKKSTKQYSCIIIDDDSNGIEVIKEHISLVPKLQLIKSYLNPMEALRKMEKFKNIDFLFLDINMQMSGLDVARLIREHVRFIIFVTGHPEHALQAFQVEADHFLSKPIRFTKFLLAINQLLHKRMSSRLRNLSPYS
ncbi:LytR/AlgR family response regulator transcription factor [Pedobacter frigidisoli]|uniref:LytR/AlgR family response regulator transcription factor n=1 Tax=Pedobacter frigidisoli TaxID=2530455 RepID=UPI00292FBDFF|nr:response regulator [Pedobacter frigidisoli]